MTTRIYVLNSSKEVKNVDILSTSGEKDSIYVQPGGRPYLAAGWVVDPVYLRRNPEVRAVEMDLEGGNEQ